MDQRERDELLERFYHPTLSERPEEQRGAADWDRVVDGAQHLLERCLATSLPQGAHNLVETFRFLCCGARASYYRNRLDAVGRFLEGLTELKDRVLPIAQTGPAVDAGLHLITTLSYLHRNQGHTDRARHILMDRTFSIHLGSDAQLAALYKEQGNLWRYVGEHILALSCYLRAKQFLDPVWETPVPGDDDRNSERWSLLHFMAANDCELLELQAMQPGFFDHPDYRLQKRALEHLDMLEEQPPACINVPFEKKHRGFFEMVRGNRDRAQGLFHESWNRFLDLGFVKGQALCRYTEGAGMLVLAKRSGSRDEDLRNALELFETARSMSTEANYRRGVLLSLFGEGRCRLALGEVLNGRQALEDVLQQAREIGNETLENLATLALVSEDDAIPINRQVIEYMEMVEAKEERAEVETRACRDHLQRVFEAEQGRPAFKVRIRGFLAGRGAAGGPAGT